MQHFKQHAGLRLTAFRGDFKSPAVVCDEANGWD